MYIEIEVDVRVGLDGADPFSKGRWMVITKVDLSQIGMCQSIHLGHFRIIKIEINSGVVSLFLSSKMRSALYSLCHNTNTDKYPREPRLEHNRN